MSQRSQKTGMIAALLVALGIWMVPQNAVADGPEGNAFGLGFALGNPSSITGKYYLSDENFLDFHLGAFRLYDRRFYEDSLFLGADYAWEVYNFHEDETVSMPFYVGVGGGLIVDTDGNCEVVRNGRCFDLDRADYFDFAIGPRMLVGTAFQFQKAPLELFVEFSPSLYFVFYDERYQDNFAVAFEVLNLAIGGRFYFGG